jgi:hypothetical protein
MFGWNKKRLIKITRVHESWNDFTFPAESQLQILLWLAAGANFQNQGNLVKYCARFFFRKKL